MTPETAANKYHWIKYDPATNIIEMFLDHHSLSSSRMCESMFVFNHLLHINPNYGKIPAETVDPVTGDRKPLVQIKKEIIEKIGTASSEINVLDPNNYEQVYIERRKPWFLDYGEYLHYMFEIFYKSFIHTEKEYIFDNLLGPGQKCLNMMDFLEIGKKVWLLMDMDWYATNGTDRDKDCYKEVAGWGGVSMLLTQYYSFYMDLRVRVVDTEIIFGYDREVPLGSFTLHDYFIIGKHSNLSDRPIVKCYLTGRIDLLIDNGNKIGPVDHKHTHKFTGFESDHFNPQDAVTGYILATRCILEKNYPKYFEQGRECLSAWIYHTSGCIPSVNKKTKLMGPRFKTTPVDKTHSQLEDFKARQLSSFKRIAELLFNNKYPEWNTLVCDNIFNRECQYKVIHRNPSEQWEQIIKSHFLVGKAWNPRERDSDKLDEILKSYKK